jgi:excisionase family DNA binding protein
VRSRHAFTWEQPNLVIDGVVCTATWDWLVEHCGPPPRRSRTSMAPTGEFLTADEVAAVLHVGRTTAYELASRIGVRVGRAVRVARRALDAYLRDSCGSSSAGSGTGRSSTTSGFPSRRKIAKLRSAHSVSSNAVPLIRPIVPRTKARCA